jgi:hypothetical protein
MLGAVFYVLIASVVVHPSSIHSFLWLKTEGLLRTQFPECMRFPACHIDFTVSVFLCIVFLVHGYQ